MIRRKILPVEMPIIRPMLVSSLVGVVPGSGAIFAPVAANIGVKPI